MFKERKRGGVEGRAMFRCASGRNWGMYRRMSIGEEWSCREAEVDVQERVAKGPFGGWSMHRGAEK